jgi:periplasmic copper chaperone A
VGAGLLLTGPASAHVSVQPGTAEQGGFTKVAFRVPNERANASTSKLEVILPTDHPISFVSMIALVLAFLPWGRSFASSGGTRSS